MNVLLAAFYTPGVRAIEYLLGRGFRPQQIRLLTHDMERNRLLMKYAAEHAIHTTTLPIKSPEAYDWIRQFEPDVLFSLYFRDIVPEAILDIPPLGAVNLHPSLLPKYRGAFSAPRVIINGDEYTGFTYHYMVAKVDAGNVILQRSVPVKDSDTAYSLYHRLIGEGMSAFGEAFELVTKHRYPGTEQVGEASYYPRTVPFGGYIDPRWSRERIDRFIRAMYFPPFKGACVRLTGGGEREVLSLSDYDAILSTGQVQFAEGGNA